MMVSRIQYGCVQDRTLDQTLILHGHVLLRRPIKSYFFNEFLRGNLTSGIKYFEL